MGTIYVMGPLSVEIKDKLLIVGVPRSGSTLLAALVDSLDNTVCLSEPRRLFISPDAKDRSTYLGQVVDEIEDCRKRILSGEKVADRRNPDGTPTTNYVKRMWGRARLKPGKGYVDTTLYRSGLLVAVKHNVPFMSVLPELVASGIPIIGVVRHPIPTILSWKETSLPISRGYMPSAQAFWPELNEVGKLVDSFEERSALIFEMLCARLKEQGVPVITYEEVTADPSKLEGLIGRKMTRKIEIRPKHWLDYKGAITANRIHQALQKYGRAMRTFYPEIDSC